MKRKILALVMDLAVAAALLGGIYGVNYMIPQKGVAAQPLQASASENEPAEAAENTGNSSGAASGEQNNAAGQSSREQQLQALLDGNRNGLPATKVSLDSAHWRQKFAGKFTDQVVSADTCWRISMWQTSHVCRPASLRIHTARGIPKNCRICRRE